MRCCQAHRRRQFRGSVVSTANLVSFWKLDQASGTRSDSHGSNDLADNNTVGQGAGTVYSNCADFELSNSEYLSAADVAAFNFSSFSFCAWIKLESSSGHLVIGGQDDYGTGASTDRAWTLVVNPSDRLELYLFYSGASYSSVADANFGTLSTGVWYHVACYHDQGTEIAVAVNGTKTTLALNQTMNNSTADLTIGTHLNNNVPAESFDGLEEAAGLWSRVLSDPEITALADPNDPFYTQF